MRSAFVDPSTYAMIIGFDCDMFKVTCKIDAHQLTVLCTSRKYRLDLVEKFINFTVFASIYALEHSEIPRTNLRAKRFVLAKKESLVDFEYIEESSINLLRDDSILSSMRYNHDCTLRSSRPSIVKQIQPKLDSD